MKINKKIIRLKRFIKQIVMASEARQSQRMACLKARKSVSLLLVMILSLFLVAVPMAGMAQTWSDNFDGGAQQTWIEVDQGANSTFEFTNDRYQLHTEYNTTDGAVASYVDSNAIDCIMQSRVQKINDEDVFLAYLLARSDQTNGNGYVLGVSTPGGGGVPHLWLGKLTAWGYVSLASISEQPVFDPNDCQLKFAVVGNNLYGKVWNTGSNEPEDWQISGTDSDYPNGVGGLMVATYHTLGWDTVQAAFDDVSLTVLSESEVWVDNDWVGTDPGVEVEPGKIFNYNAFATIQSAIDGASSGNTINVADGTYTITSKILVNKGITITGNIGSPSSVVVTYAAPDQTLDCFDIQANNVTVQGISAVNGRYGFNFAATDPTGCTISDCVIDHCYEGAINIDGGSGHIISNNTITNCLTSGGHRGDIHIENCPDVTISGNTMTDNGLSSGKVEPYHTTIEIYVKYTYPASPIEGVRIVGNVISGHLGDCADIQIYDAPYTDIYNNTISNSEDKGIAIFGKQGNPAYTSTDNRVQVMGNTISSTYYPGVQACNAPYTYFYNNTLTQCNYYGGDGTGDFDYASIHIDAGSANCLIDSNTVSDGINGIQLWSDNCTVTNNTIYDMGTTYNGDKVVGSRTYKNSGILVGSNWGSGDIDPTGTTIQFNNIHDNYWGLFYSADLTNTVTAENNWWGAASGPTHADNPGGTGDKVSDNVDYTPWYIDEGKTTLSNDITVTFNKNGGDTEADPQTKTATYGGNVGTLPTAPTKTGYDFASWNTETEGGGTEFTAATAVTADITVYAQWTINSYTVTFDSDDAGAAGTMADQTIASGSSANLTACGFTKTGWTFAGWAETSGGAVAYADQESYTMGTANVTLYAQWTAIDYTVTFNKNGGDTEANPQTKTAIYGGNVGTLPTAPTKTGYGFASWNTQADGNGTEFTAATAVTADITVYAQWTINSYTVTFDSQGGSAVASQTVEHGGKVTEPTAPTKEGYTFGGWYKESECTNAWVFAIDTVTSNVTLYAKWTSSVATLSDLTVDGTTVSGFSLSTLTYNKVLPYGTTEVPTVGATTPTDSNATKVITQATNLTGTEAERTATVVVTAEDGTTSKTYKVIFGSIKVTITKTGPTTANQGNNIIYTIHYKNEGTFDATNVVITETYPAEVEFVSSDPVTDTGTDNQWTIGTLAPGEEETITVTVHIK